MRVCKYCNVKLSDNEINCPLCGAHTDVVDASVLMPSGEYPQTVARRSRRKVVKKVFGAISILIVMAFLLVSFLTKNWSYILITGSALLYIWLGILQYIFNSHSVRQILGGIFLYLIVFINLIFLHYYFNGVANAMNISLGIVTPVLLAVLNVTYMMIVFISGKWYRYAYQTMLLAILEIACLVLVICLKYFVVASIVCASIGFATIVFSFVFGRDVMFAEFKKRCHL